MSTGRAKSTTKREDASRCRVKVTLHAPGYARFRAFGLPPARFEEYKKASEGARYVRELRAVLTPIDKVPAILVRLRKAGFPVDAEPELRRLLQKRERNDWIDIEALKERIAKIDEELFALTGDRLFPYQRTGARWLAPLYGALLADEQGLGKTLELLVSLPSSSTALVVAPAVAKGDWRSELRKWRPQVKNDVLEGRDSFRWPRPGEVLITNYDILPSIHDGRVCNGKLPKRPCRGCSERIVFRDVEVEERLPNGTTRVRSKRIAETVKGHTQTCEKRKRLLPAQDCPGCHPLLKQAPKGMVLIADEAQNLKNGKSLRTKKFRALSEAVRAADGRVWLASGTPLTNKPPELWAVFKAAGIAEASFGSYDNFVRLFKGKEGEFGGYEWGLPDDELREHLQRFMLRRLKRDVLPQLPTLRWSNREVEIAPKKLRQIDAFLKQSKRTVADIVDLLERKEIGFEEMSSVRAALASAKIPAMLEVVEDFEDKGEPLVVFSAHRAPIDILAKRPGWVSITGDETAIRKTEAADQFQNGYYADIRDPDLPGEGLVVKNARRRTDAKGNVLYPLGIAITISAGSVSLTLTRACFELFVDLAWTPAAVQQAAARCVRIGQTRGTLAMVLVANHQLDERVAEVILKKTRLISASIDAAADGTDAPLLTEAEIDKSLQEVREAIACGRAVRRPPLTAEEKDAFEALHSLRFSHRNNERLAAELAFEAETVGLSDAQWALAQKLVVQQRAQQQAAEDAKAKAEKAAKLRKRPSEIVETRSHARSIVVPAPARASWANRRGGRRSRGAES